MRRGNRERILDASVELFNFSGTVAVTTNHIAKHLKISPGNLYFHFRDKEEIIRELFQRLNAAVYAAWDAKAGLEPERFLANSLEVFWTYRFFHREMYHLRRQDPLLAKAWKRHMRLCYKLFKLYYREWLRSGLVREIRAAEQLQRLSESLLLTSSASLGFFESLEKPASRRVLRSALDHVNQVSQPYYAGRLKPPS